MDFAEATRREDQQEPRDVRPCPASRVSMQPPRPKNRSLATASRSTREFPTTPMQHHCVCGRPARSHPHWLCGTLSSLWTTKPPRMLRVVHYFLRCTQDFLLLLLLRTQYPVSRDYHLAIPFPKRPWSSDYMLDRCVCVLAATQDPPPHDQ